MHSERVSESTDITKETGKQETGEEMLSAQTLIPKSSEGVEGIHFAQETAINR